MTTDSEFTDAIAAIHAGDVATLQRLLADNPGLATSRLGGAAKGRTPLHVVADWPGYFPNGPQVVRMLIEAGADPNARDPDQPRSETPLHWAASSDDVDVARALIDGGADGGNTRTDRSAPRSTMPLSATHALACRSPPRAARCQGRQALACGRPWHARSP